MKWHSLLKDPNIVPQRINKYDESEDVLVIEKCYIPQSLKFAYIRSDYVFYYGHWEPNGDEGWRVRSKDYSDCGKFGGFDIDTHYREVQEESLIDEYDLNDYSEKEQEFIKNNCTYSEALGGWLTREIVGWAYFPNEDDFIEENQEYINQNTKVC